MVDLEPTDANERARDARILVVDDQDGNLRVLKRLLGDAGYHDVTITNDSAQAVAICRETPPDLLVLDLHMPGIDGFGVLEQITGARTGDAHFPVLVLTGDVAMKMRRAALAAGADDYLVKPVDPLETLLRVRNLIGTQQLQQSLRDEKVRLEEKVHERTAELEIARNEVLSRLALATEYRDDVTQEHAQRIGRTACQIVEAAGIGEIPAKLIERAAQLHDIGKLGIPDAVLLKPGPLDAQEFELMKTHTTIGADILSGSRSPSLQLGEEIALNHHERWDGSGYPNGLAGEDIPLAGRIVAVADVFDALTHARPYKEAWPVPDAVATIVADAGSHFDPRLVEAFAGLDHEALLAPVGYVLA
ncbi:MAG: Two-component system response regulator [Solirubrobacterales bacterium]|nr:Two-component system response regulator [Solirubrobacterales bacterium]